MVGDHAKAYAEALFAVTRVEGNEARVEDELFRFARGLEGSEELQKALADAETPIARRLQIVEDLLGAAADGTTVGIVSMLVSSGRSNDIPEIVDAFVERVAHQSGRRVATVRSAVELTTDQQQRLAAALRNSVGSDVTVKVIVDPSILGGIVTEIGDTVIDGSVRRRLHQLREAF